MANNNNKKNFYLNQKKGYTQLNLYVESDIKSVLESSKINKATKKP